MLPITGWELVYTDGTVVTSATTTWRDAPATGVQVLVVWHAKPYTTLFYGTDPFLLPGQPLATAKQGELMEDASFYALVDTVLARVKAR